MNSALLLANLAAPSIVSHLPGMVMLLVPIVVLETIIVRRRLDGGHWTLARHVMVANLASTVIGIPVAWGLMLGLAGAGEMSGIEADPTTSLGLLGVAIMNAAAGGSGLHGLATPLAIASTIVMLVPYLLASILIETWVIRRRLPDTDPVRIRTAVRLANLSSYGLLAALLMGELWATVA